MSLPAWQWTHRTPRALANERMVRTGSVRGMSFGSTCRFVNVWVSRLDLMTQVWGYSAAVVSRTVDTHVAELRRKLEDRPSEPRHLLTVRKIGYRLRR